MGHVHGVMGACLDAVDALPPGVVIPGDPVRWMVGELRVSLFAQTLGTRHPVSETRVRAALDAAETCVAVSRKPNGWPIPLPDRAGCPRPITSDV